MEHDDLVFEAVSYRRNVGADLDSIRAYVGVRESERRESKHDKEALARLKAEGKVIQLGELWFLTSGAYKQAKGAALAAEWKREDAWILLSLLYNREKGQSGLEDVIATADAINRAVPTLDEMYGALNRLDAASLIKREQDTFTVTEAALELFSKVQAKCKKNIYAQLDCLRRVMDCPCCGVALKAIRWRINIEPSEYRKAMETYSEGF